MPQTPDPHPDEPTPPIKEFALVGQFFFQWSYMEAMITNHIRDLLGFRSIEGSIVLANVAFRDKVNILATLVELQMRKRGKEGKAEIKKVFNDLKSLPPETSSHILPSSRDQRRVAEV